MLPVPDAVAAKLPHLPDGPGVYMWKGRDGTTLYIGKAKKLRSRVRSYFANDQLESVKTRHLRSEEHTSELQSQSNLVCRLLLEKKKRYASRGISESLTPHVH